MKTKNHPNFDPEFPETFNWAILDSPKLATLAVKLAAQIGSDSLFPPSQRHLTPGLRFALNQIAENSEI